MVITNIAGCVVPEITDVSSSVTIVDQDNGVVEEGGVVATTTTLTVTCEDSTYENYWTCTNGEWDTTTVLCAAQGNVPCY